MKYERRRDKSGKVYYWNKEESKFTSKKNFFRQFQDRGNYLSIEELKSLSKNEKISYAANKRVRENGKFVSKFVEGVFQKEVKEQGIKIINNDIEATLGAAISERLKKATGEAPPEQVEKLAEQAIKQLKETVYPRFMNTKPKNGFTVDKKILDTMKSGKEFRYIDRNGKEHTGKEAFLKMQEERAKRTNKSKKANPVYLYQVEESEDGIFIDDRETVITGS